MRSRRSDAILLRVQELQEHDRVVTFLARNAGKRRGVARGSRRRYSRFAGQLQPLARCHIHWFEPRRADLVRVNEVDLLRPPGTWQQDLEGLLLASYLAEHVDAFAPEAEVSDPQYRLLDSVLDGLDAGIDRALAARYFEVWMLRLAGVFPVPVQCPHCGARLRREAWLPASGEGVICGTCSVAEGGGGMRVTAPALAFLQGSGRSGLAALGQDEGPGPDVLHSVEEICGRVRRAFLQAELRSYEVMNTTLALAPAQP